MEDVKHLAAVTDATFQAEVEQHIGLAVVDFWATWCGPCHMVAPIMDQLAGKYNGKVKIVKVDVTPIRRRRCALTSARFRVFYSSRTDATWTRWWVPIRRRRSSKRSTNIFSSFRTGGRCARALLA